MIFSRVARRSPGNPVSRLLPRGKTERRAAKAKLLASG